MTENELLSKCREVKALAEQGSETLKELRKMRDEAVTILAETRARNQLLAEQRERGDWVDWVNGRIEAFVDGFVAACKWVAAGLVWPWRRGGEAGTITVGGDTTPERTAGSFEAEGCVAKPEEDISHMLPKEDESPGWLGRASTIVYCHPEELEHARSLDVAMFLLWQRACLVDDLAEPVKRVTDLLMSDLGGLTFSPLEEYEESKKWLEEQQKQRSEAGK